MSIRIRTVPAGTIAVCAARSVPLPGDIYLDDAAHHALSLKFALDFEAMGFLPARDHSAPPDAGVEDRRPLIAAMEEAESNNPNRASWDKEYAAPTLPPVGERPVYHYCCECGERLPTRWNEPYCTEHRALLTSRPSPAPSGEPVAFQMRHRRLGGEFCGWEDFVTRENRERWAAIATRQGLHVELRDLIPVAAPHPDGQGVG